MRTEDRGLGGEERKRVETAGQGKGGGEPSRPISWNEHSQ